MNTAAIPRELTINNDAYVRKDAVFAVIPPILQTMVASPYIINAQAYIDGHRHIDHDEMRFNVLYVQRATDGGAVVMPAVYIVLAGIGNDFNSHCTGETYFNTNAVYVDDDIEHLCVLYDVSHHKMYYRSPVSVLNTAFEHRTMTLDEVCATFFRADDPVYGKRFNKDAIRNALNIAAGIDYVDPYPLIPIAEFIGVNLRNNRVKKLSNNK